MYEQRQTKSEYIVSLDESSEFIENSSLEKVSSEHLEVYSYLNRLSCINRNNLRKLSPFSPDALIGLHEFCIGKDKPFSSKLIPFELEQVVSLEYFHAIKKITKHMNLMKSDFHALFELSENNLLRLKEMICNLLDAGLLTQESYKKALDLIKIKPPKILLSSLNKKSRKINDISHSQFSISNSACTFFIEHSDKKEYPQGSAGKVKKGYSINKSNNHQEYAIKIYFEDSGAEKHARKNAKYQSLLGRESWLCKRNQIYSTIYPWQKGRVLNQFSREDLMEIPLLTRFTCLINGLSQLEKLHENLFVHGDVGSHNFIMNFDSDKCLMALIDFDCAKKDIDVYSIHNDICSMGETIAFMFPELNKKKKREMNPLEYAIYLLNSAMNTALPSEMCINRNALIFCKDVFSMVSNDHPDLPDNNTIQEIADETILQDTISDESILRGKIRC